MATHEAGKISGRNLPYAPVYLGHIHCKSMLKLGSFYGGKGLLLRGR